jgi:dolichyl-phosphate-mannose--protein O-mannosyl transferase
MLADQRPNHLRMWFVPAVVGLLLVFALELFFSVRLESQTFDEAAHLYAGYSYWLHSDFGVNPEHPPFVKLVASLPLLLSRPRYPPPLDIFFRGSSAVGGVMLFTPPGSDVLLARARFAVSIFAFVLALLVVLASYEMFGRWAALFALALLVFDPLLVAHGALLGTDVGATCCFFAAIYTFYRYIKRPSPAKLAICGVAVGLALAAKHSAILSFRYYFCFPLPRSCFSEQAPTRIPITRFLVKIGPSARSISGAPGWRSQLSRLSSFGRSTDFGTRHVLRANRSYPRRLFTSETCTLQWLRT